MNTHFKKVVAAGLALAVVATLFTSCDLTSKNTTEPVEVSLKSELNDAVFTFSYGELKGVVPADKLAKLFEQYDKLNDDVTIELSYYDITKNFTEGSDTFNAVMALVSDADKAKMTDNTQQVLTFLSDKLNSAKQQRPVTEYKESFWVEEKTIKFTDKDGKEADSKVKDAATYFSDFVTKGVSGKLLKGTTAAGDDLSDILYLYGSQTGIMLTSDDVVSAVSSVTKESQTNSDKQYVVTGLTRTVKIVLKDSPESVAKAFSLKDKQPILDEMKKASSYFTVDDYSVAFKGCTITATFDATDDELVSVTYDNNMIVTANVNGTGSLESLGAQMLTFNCTDRMEYKFGWDSQAK